MFYYFNDKHKLLEVKLEFKGHDYVFNSYEMQLYSVVRGQKRIPFIAWIVKTGALLIAQIHGYLLGLKSIKTLIAGLNLLPIISTMVIKFTLNRKLFLCCIL
jgi:hypothetical protein